MIITTCNILNHPTNRINELPEMCEIIIESQLLNLLALSKSSSKLIGIRIIIQPSYCSVVMLRASRFKSWDSIIISHISGSSLMRFVG